MIKGLRKHRNAFAHVIGPGVPSVDQLIARFQEHLDAMAEASQREIAWRAALEREARLEKGIKNLMTRVKPLVEGTFGPSHVTLRDFGLKPYARHKPSLATMELSIEKRLATRALRKTMGRRRKKRINAPAA